MFLIGTLIIYIHTWILNDRTKQLSDYLPQTVHVAYLTIGGIYMLIACLTNHALNDVNDPNYTPKNQRWRVIIWTKNAFRYVSKGMTKAID